MHDTIYIMQPTQKTWVYILIDPRDNNPKYVGKSVRPSTRFSEHITKCLKENTKKGNWIKKLTKIGLKPIMQLIHETTENDVAIWEEHYIKHYTDLGFELLNYDDKGIGTTKVRTKETIDNMKTKNTKSVYQYDLNGVLIQQHKSLREAERQTGINHGNVSKCCSGKFKHTGGFIFSYIPINDIQQLKNPNAQKKKVLEIDIDGNIIAEYVSIAEAAKITGVDASNISRVCSGIKKCVKSRYFKFKE